MKKMPKEKPVIYVPMLLAPEQPQREILDPVAAVITGEPGSEDEFLAILQKADVVLLSSGRRLKRQVIERCPRLKLIAKYGVGVDTIDVDAATELGIPVINVPLANSNAVAELTIGLMFAVIRPIQGAKEWIRSGGWQDESFVGRELHHSTIGIIGYGNIAKKVIRRLRGFDVPKIMVYTESGGHGPPPDTNVEFVDLQTLLKNSDLVSIHKALTPRSIGLIGEEELRLMKKSAYLINTARGTLVKEEALIRALQEGWIAGAGLDVYEHEPLPPTSPLLSLNNTVLTPHIGGATVEARYELVITMAKNIVDYLSGKAIHPTYIVNKEILSRKG
jgi:D-3-phosphoglycerate dehydrogenase